MIFTYTWLIPTSSFLFCIDLYSTIKLCVSTNFTLKRHWLDRQRRSFMRLECLHMNFLNLFRLLRRGSRTWNAMKPELPKRGRATLPNKQYAIYLDHLEKARFCSFSPGRNWRYYYRRERLWNFDTSTSIVIIDDDSGEYVHDAPVIYIVYVYFYLLCLCYLYWLTERWSNLSGEKVAAD